MLLEIRNLSVSYGKALALEDVSMDVGEREFVAVLGPNGAGKSTLLKAISRVQPSSGRLVFRGESLHGMAPHAVVGKGICHCPEGRRLFPRLTVNENLLMGAFRKVARPDIERDPIEGLKLPKILADRTDGDEGLGHRVIYNAPRAKRRSSSICSGVRIDTTSRYQEPATIRSSITREFA